MYNVEHHHDSTLINYQLFIGEW